MEVKNMIDDIKNMEVCFPWRKVIRRKLLKSFPEVNEEILQLLHESIIKEFENFDWNDTHRAESFYATLKHFYLHFFWKVKWNEESRFISSCIPILFYMSHIGLRLSSGNVESEWLDRILLILKTFPGDLCTIFDVLLLIKNMKKKYQSSYATIIRSILCDERIRNPFDAECFIKIILLFRRLKSLSKYNLQEINILSMASKIKCPSDVICWISSLNIDSLCGITEENVVQRLLKKKLKPDVVQKLFKVLFENKYDERITNLRFSSKSKIKESASNEKESIYIPCTDSKRNNEIRQNRRHLKMQSHKKLKRKKIKLKEQQKSFSDKSSLNRQQKNISNLSSNVKQNSVAILNKLLKKKVQSHSQNSSRSGNNTLVPNLAVISDKVLNIEVVQDDSKDHNNSDIISKEIFENLKQSSKKRKRKKRSYLQNDDLLHKLNKESSTFIESSNCKEHHKNIFLLSNNILKQNSDKLLNIEMVQSDIQDHNNSDISTREIFENLELSSTRKRKSKKRQCSQNNDSLCKLKNESSSIINDKNDEKLQQSVLSQINNTLEQNSDKLLSIEMIQGNNQDHSNSDISTKEIFKNLEHSSPRKRKSKKKSCSQDDDLVHELNKEPSTCNKSSSKKEQHKNNHVLPQNNNQDHNNCEISTKEIFENLEYSSPRKRKSKKRLFSQNADSLHKMNKESPTCNKTNGREEQHKNILLLSSDTLKGNSDKSLNTQMVQDINQDHNDHHIPTKKMFENLEHSSPRKRKSKKKSCSQNDGLLCKLENELSLTFNSNNSHKEPHKNALHSTTNALKSNLNRLSNIELILDNSQDHINFDNSTKEIFENLEHSSPRQRKSRKKSCSQNDDLLQEEQNMLLNNEMVQDNSQDHNNSDISAKGMFENLEHSSPKKRKSEKRSCSQNDSLLRKLEKESLPTFNNNNNNDQKRQHESVLPLTNNTLEQDSSNFNTFVKEIHNKSEHSPSKIKKSRKRLYSQNNDLVKDSVLETSLKCPFEVLLNNKKVKTHSENDLECNSEQLVGYRIHDISKTPVSSNKHIENYADLTSLPLTHLNSSENQWNNRDLNVIHNNTCKENLAHFVSKDNVLDALPKKLFENDSNLVCNNISDSSSLSCLQNGDIISNASELFVAVEPKKSPLTQSRHSCIYKKNVGAKNVNSKSGDESSTRQLVNNENLCQDNKSLSELQVDKNMHIKELQRNNVEGNSVISTQCITSISPTPCSPKSIAPVAKLFSSPESLDLKVSHSPISVVSLPRNILERSRSIYSPSDSSTPSSNETVSNSTLNCENERKRLRNKVYKVNQEHDISETRKSTKSGRKCRKCVVSRKFISVSSDSSDEQNVSSHNTPRILNTLSKSSVKSSESLKICSHQPESLNCLTLNSKTSFLVNNNSPENSERKKMKSDTEQKIEEFHLETGNTLHLDNIHSENCNRETIIRSDNTQNLSEAVSLKVNLKSIIQPSEIQNITDSIFECDIESTSENQSKDIFVNSKNHSKGESSGTTESICSIKNNPKKRLKSKPFILESSSDSCDEENVLKHSTPKALNISSHKLKGKDAVLCKEVQISSHDCSAPQNHSVISSQKNILHKNLHTTQSENSLQTSAENNSDNSLHSSNNAVLDSNSCKETIVQESNSFISEDSCKKIDPKILFSASETDSDGSMCASGGESELKDFIEDSDCNDNNHDVSSYSQLSKENVAENISCSSRDSSPKLKVKSRRYILESDYSESEDEHIPDKNQQILTRGEFDHRNSDNSVSNDNQQSLDSKDIENLSISSRDSSSKQKRKSKLKAKRHVLESDSSESEDQHVSDKTQQISTKGEFDCRNSDNSVSSHSQQLLCNKDATENVSDSSSKQKREPRLKAKKCAMKSDSSESENQQIWTNEQFDLIQSDQVVLSHVQLPNKNISENASLSPTNSSPKIKRNPKLKEKLCVLESKDQHKLDGIQQVLINGQFDRNDSHSIVSYQSRQSFNNKNIIENVSCSLRNSSPKPKEKSKLKSERCRFESHSSKFEARHVPVLTNEKFESNQIIPSHNQQNTDAAENISSLCSRDSLPKRKRKSESCVFESDNSESKDQHASNDNQQAMTDINAFYYNSEDLFPKIYDECDIQLSVAICNNSTVSSPSCRCDSKIHLGQDTSIKNVMVSPASESNLSLKKSSKLISQSLVTSNTNSDHLTCSFQNLQKQSNRNYRYFSESDSSSSEDQHFSNNEVKMVSDIFNCPENNLSAAFQSMKSKSPKPGKRKTSSNIKKSKKITTRDAHSPRGIKISKSKRYIQEKSETSTKDSLGFPLSEISEEMQSNSKLSNLSDPQNLALKSKFEHSLEISSIASSQQDEAVSDSSEDIPLSEILVKLKNNSNLSLSQNSTVKSNFEQSLEINSDVSVQRNETATDSSELLSEISGKITNDSDLSNYQNSGLSSNNEQTLEVNSNVPMEQNEDVSDSSEDIPLAEISAKLKNNSNISDSQNLAQKFNFEQSLEMNADVSVQQNETISESSDLLSEISEKIKNNSNLLSSDLNSNCEQSLEVNCNVSVQQNNVILDSLDLPLSEVQEKINNNLNGTPQITETLSIDLNSQQGAEKKLYSVNDCEKYLDESVYTSSFVSKSSASKETLEHSLQDVSFNTKTHLSKNQSVLECKNGVNQLLIAEKHQVNSQEFLSSEKNIHDFEKDKEYASQEFSIDASDEHLLNTLMDTLELDTNSFTSEDYLKNLFINSTLFSSNEHNFIHKSSFPNGNDNLSSAILPDSFINYVKSDLPFNLSNINNFCIQDIQKVNAKSNGTSVICNSQLKFPSESGTQVSLINTENCKLETKQNNVNTYNANLSMNFNQSTKCNSEPLNQYVNNDHQLCKCCIERASRFEIKKNITQVSNFETCQSQLQQCSNSETIEHSKKLSEETFEMLSASEDNQVQFSNDKTSKANEKILFICDVLKKSCEVYVVPEESLFKVLHKSAGVTEEESSCTSGDTCKFSCMTGLYSNEFIEKIVIDNDDNHKLNVSIPEGYIFVNGVKVATSSLFPVVNLGKRCDACPLENKSSHISTEKSPKKELLETERRQQHSLHLNSPIERKMQARTVTRTAKKSLNKPCNNNETSENKNWCDECPLENESSHISTEKSPEKELPETERRRQHSLRLNSPVERKMQARTVTRTAKKSLNKPYNNNETSENKDWCDECPLENESSHISTEKSPKKELLETERRQQHSLHLNSPIERKMQARTVTRTAKKSLNKPYNNNETSENKNSKIVTDSEHQTLSRYNFRSRKKCSKTCACGQTNDC